MFCYQIVVGVYPFLQIKNSTKKDVISLCKSLGFSSIVILDKETYIGVVSMHQISQFDDATHLADLKHLIVKLGVKSTDYFLASLSFFSESSLPFVPVIDQEAKCCGIITKDILLQSLSLFLNTKRDGLGGFMVLQMDKVDYSFVELARIIENNNASILQLNTYQDDASNIHYICIKVNRVNITDIMAALERYNYQIVYFNGKEQYDIELMQNYFALMNYLNV